MEEALNVQSKTTIPHQPSGLDGKAPNSSYNQQQPRSNNSPYHPYDSDATQSKYSKLNFTLRQIKIHAFLLSVMAGLYNHKAARCKILFKRVKTSFRWCCSCLCICSVLANVVVRSLEHSYHNWLYSQYIWKFITVFYFTLSLSLVIGLWPNGQRRKNISSFSINPCKNTVFLRFIQFF